MSLPSDDDWRQRNRANWDERVDIHLAAPSYDLTPLKEGRARLHPIEEALLPDLTAKRVIHLQCHFGRDTFTLAQKGAAQVVGVDFSPKAIAAAKALAPELGLETQTRFVLSDIYDAPQAVAKPAAFDLAFASWGTIGWLPDIKGWAKVVAQFLKPGGSFYFFEGHPLASVFDDETPFAPGIPGWFVPYHQTEALVEDWDRDYADPEARLKNTRTHEWMHPTSAVIAALMGAGLELRHFSEHDEVPWRMFEMLEEAPGGMYRWPDKPWLPLSYALVMQKPL